MTNPFKINDRVRVRDDAETIPSSYRGELATVVGLLPDEYQHGDVMIHFDNAKPGWVYPISWLALDLAWTVEELATMTRDRIVAEIVAAANDMGVEFLSPPSVFVPTTDAPIVGIARLVRAEVGGVVLERWLYDMDDECWKVADEQSFNASQLARMLSTIERWTPKP